STPVFLPVISGLAAIYYFAFERASNQGIKWMFSGVGSEEIFAGFVDRTNEDLNIQCKRRLHTIYHRDLYRDFAIAKHFGIRTVAPFLDIDFAYYALDIPPYLKVCKGYKKYIWRCASEIIGTPKKNCWRQNKATQYGSGIDRLVTQLAKESGLVYKKKYIEWLIDGKELPSEKIEIRVVDLSHDWASLKRLVHQVLHEHGFDFKTSKVKNEICNIPSLYLDDGTFLVAVCNDKCIGTIGIRKKDGKEKDCVLENMYIQKHFRSRGLGTRLFNAALDFAKEMTFSRMYVSVHDKYSKGKIFFEKRGFVKIGRNKNEDVYELKLK
ncbi:MAG: GNAT family N-acetyltransferase, partial [Thermoplasmata archaeon]